MISKPCHIL